MTSKKMSTKRCWRVGIEIKIRGGGNCFWGRDASSLSKLWSVRWFVWFLNVLAKCVGKYITAFIS
jgi:hypothetical protein